MTTKTHGGRRPGAGRPPTTPDAAIRRCLQLLDQAITAALSRPGGHGIDKDDGEDTIRTVKK